MARRPRPQVMRLTDAAADRIKAIMAKADKPFAGVRVGVKNGGCAGMAYTMEYAESAAKFDEVVEDKGVKLLIDPKAVLFLLGTEMDFKVDKLSSTFVFNNPNQTSACGCGESVQLTPAADPAGAEGAPAHAMDADSIRELFQEFGPVSVRRMFGGAGRFRRRADDRASSPDGVIYLKADAETIPQFETRRPRTVQLCDQGRRAHARVILAHAGPTL